MIKRKFIAYLIVSMFLLIGISASVVADSDSDPFQTTNNSEMKKWTFMIYDDADFTSEWYDPGIFAITREAPICKNINIVVLQDTVYGPAKMWYIGPFGHKRIIKRMGEIDMGEYETLKDFVEFCKENFPAERYMLDIFNHGGGWLGACSDITDNGWLTMEEMKRALTETGGVDIITFNAPCNMGAVESVYELRDCADVYVGSEAGNLYDFRILRPICKILNNDHHLSTIEIGGKIIEIIRNVEKNSIQLYPFPRATMSAMRTDEVTKLLQAIDNLSTYLYNNLEEYHDDIKLVYSKSQYFYDSLDLYDFAQNFYKISEDEDLKNCLLDVMNAVNNTVIDEYHSLEYPGSYGLTIHFPELLWSDLYNQLYQNEIEFSNDTHWDEFLMAYNELYFKEVNHDGTADFTTIQDAIDNASEDDAIYVYTGTYNENIVINKSIILVAEYYPNLTIINGDKSGDVVTITADGVKLYGFIIRNSSNEGAGVNIYSDSVKVIGNWFQDNNIGVYLNGSSNNLILGNAIEKSGEYGIFLDSSNNNYMLNNMFITNRKDASFLNSYKNTWDNNYLDHPKRRINLIFGKKTIGGFSIPQINIDRHRKFVNYPISLT